MSTHNLSCHLCNKPAWELLDNPKAGDECIIGACEGILVEPHPTWNYSSNNSGGSFWLNDSQWYALEIAGWKVEWRERSLGAIATHASIQCATEEAAIASWVAATGEDPNAEGCSCCGQPHNFY